MNRYLVVVEGEIGNYAAYSPDVPGCIAAGETVEETLNLMQEALAIFLEETAKLGEEIPKSHTVTATFVSVPEPKPQAA